MYNPHMIFYFGLSGSILSFLVYLAPLPTFVNIFKKKSTEGFQCIPYSVSLFSAMLTLYYAFLKQNAFMLVTINSMGCFVQSIYLVVYIIFATKSIKIQTAKLLVLFNFGAYTIIVTSTFFLSSGSKRVMIVGWICAVFSVCVFAAPLSVIKLVVKTKSVEYMPFPLSFFLTLCAIMWFFYGFCLGDYFIATPNVLGFGFGVIQMILYIVYQKNRTKTEIVSETDEKPKLTETIVVEIMTCCHDHEEIVVDINPNETLDVTRKSNKGNAARSVILST